MGTHIRTLSAEDAHVLARTVVVRKASGGNVHAHTLRWFSHALKQWELQQTELRRNREVKVMIDEFDLSVVYVTAVDGSLPPIKCVSATPEFTKYLSLYELKRLKAMARPKALEWDLENLDDPEWLALRVELLAALRNGADPVAQKRLSELMDASARKRVEEAEKRQRRNRSPTEQEPESESDEPRTEGGDSPLGEAADSEDCSSHSADEDVDDLFDVEQVPRGTE